MVAGSNGPVHSPVQRGITEKGAEELALGRVASRVPVDGKIKFRRPSAA
jgi:hypothetical protein